MQRTLAHKISFDGVGLHSGVPVSMTIAPAPADSGVRFVRADVLEDPLDQRDSTVPARWDNVLQSKLCTLLSNNDGVEVSTVEHVMAALAGCGVSNATIKIDGPEAPILDGSSAGFVKAILAAGLRDQDKPSRVLKILRPIEVRDGDAYARLEPNAQMEIKFHISFEEPAIGEQDKALVMANGAFVKELSNCRTFCRQSEVEWMRANGLALGGVAGENAVVFDGDRIDGGESGLRFSDEPVRHKMLDALGDLALTGAPILGRYVGVRSGHALTNKLLRALFAQPDAWTYQVVDDDVAARLPGAGVTPQDLRAYA